MEGELIIVSIISGIFTIIGISLLNHNWFKKQEMKYNFEKYKVRQKSKGKTPPRTPAPSSPIEWIDKLKGINPETLHTLVDTLSGEGEGEGEAGLEDTIINIARENPELVKKFLGGISGTQKENPVIR